VKFRGFLRVSATSLAAIALLGLAACTPKKPAYVCEAGAAAAPDPGPPPSPAPAPPLETQDAGEAAKGAVAEAEALTPDGRVPLVTVEQTPTGPEITSTPVADEAEAEAVAEAAAVDGDLVAVEPDSIVTADALPPDDPQFGAQYALPKLGFVQTWDDSYSGPTSGAGQTVAVVDTGVQASHPDLAGQVLGGAVFGQPAPATQDHHVSGHGTRIAGIIAAVTDNGTDVAGATPAAKVLPVKVLDHNGKGFSSDVAAGIMWAADNGATVVNLSLGGPNPTDAMRFAVNHAVFTRGVPVISSSGNSGRCGSPSFPAAFEEVLAVGATDANDNSASFSTTGPFVKVVAPGVSIVSTQPQPPGFGSTSGTSFSAPYASATAAIVRARYPAFDAGDVYVRVITTATDLGPAGWDPQFGFGLINVPAAAA
jgi:subtilisin family serine protease